MKRYFVLMQSKRFRFTKRTNSLQVARWFADLNCWAYAKIHDSEASGINPPWSKCIYINDRRA